MNYLPTTLGALESVADRKEGTRWAVTGIQVEVDGPKWTATATDTKRLISVSGKDCVDLKKAPPPEIAAMTVAPNGSTKALSPGSTWKKFFGDASRLTRKTRLDCFKHVQVKMSESVVTLGASNGDESAVAPSKHVEGRFPPYKDIIPKPGKETLTIKFDPLLLAETLIAISKCRGDDPKNTPAVTLKFVDGKSPVIIEGETDEMKIVGLVMPIGG